MCTYELVTSRTQESSLKILQESSRFALEPVKPVPKADRLSLICHRNAHLDFQVSGHASQEKDLCKPCADSKQPKADLLHI